MIFSDKHGAIIKMRSYPTDAECVEQLAASVLDNFVPAFGITAEERHVMQQFAIEACQTAADCETVQELKGLVFAAPMMRVVRSTAAAVHDLIEEQSSDGQKIDNIAVQEIQARVTANERIALLQQIVLLACYHMMETRALSPGQKLMRFARLSLKGLWNGLCAFMKFSS